MSEKKQEPKKVLTTEEVDFLNLVLMLGNTASVELGVKVMKGGTKQFNLPRARQFINMLMVLDKKTEGRRTPEEEGVLKSLLGDLQQKYVAAAGLDKISPEISGLSAMALDAYTKSKKNP